MASIANLAVQLTARTGKFTSRMAAAGKPVLRLGRTVARVAARVAALGGALVGVAGVAGIGLLVRSSFKSIDALGKWSDKLGIATEKLAGLQLAAQLTGVKTETMNMALQRMTRRVAEAAAGTGEAKAALEELKLDAVALSAMGPVKAFSKIAEKMKGVATQGDRVRLAFKLFDSEGVALVNTLRLGSDGLSKVQREADKLGIALNRVEVRQIELANDAVTKLKAAFSGFVAQFAVHLAPVVEASAKLITKWATSGKGAADKLNRAMGGITATVIGLGMAWDFVRRTQLLFAKDAVNALSAAAKVILIIQRKMSGPLERLQSRFLQHHKEMLAGIRVLDRFSAKLEKKVETQPGFEFAEKIKSAIVAFRKNAFKNAADSLKETAQAGTDVGNALNKAGDAADKADKKIKNLLRGAAGSGKREFIGTVRFLGKAIEAAEKEAEKPVKGPKPHPPVRPTGAGLTRVPFGSIPEDFRGRFKIRPTGAGLSRVPFGGMPEGGLAQSKALERLAKSLKPRPLFNPEKALDRAGIGKPSEFTSNLEPTRGQRPQGLENVFSGAVDRVLVEQNDILRAIRDQLMRGTVPVLP